MDPLTRIDCAVTAASRPIPSRHIVGRQTSLALTRLDQLDVIGDRYADLRDDTRSLLDLLAATGHADPDTVALLEQLAARLGSFPSGDMLIARRHLEFVTTQLDHGADPATVLPDLAAARDAVARTTRST